MKKLCIEIRHSDGTKEFYKVSGNVSVLVGKREVRIIDFSKLYPETTTINKIETDVVIVRNWGSNL